MSELSILQLEETCKQVRIDILEMAYQSKTGHIGPAYSIVELLVALYFGALNAHPKNITDHKRDFFILSKGHAAPALFSVLSRRGFFTGDILKTYRADGGLLHGHPCSDTVPGIEISTGSLGHGLPIGAGIAHAKKKTGQPSRVFVLLGDGECNEGSIWEAAMYSAHHKLDNLVAIVDYNKFQGFGHSREVSAIEPLAQKWFSFGWEVYEINGHNLEEIRHSYNHIPKTPQKPTAIIAHTVTGKGMKHIEHTLDAHYYVPDEEIYQRTLKEIYAE